MDKIMTKPLILIVAGAALIVILFITFLYREIKQLDENERLNKLSWFLFIAGIAMATYGTFLKLG
jgi:Ni/Fe-hydrogenase subunit HybB-like protein